MRFAVFINKEGKEENIFKDQRTFKTKKWADTLRYRYSRFSEQELFTKEMPDIITDKERLDWLLLNISGKEMNRIGVFYSDQSKIRECIDTLIKVRSHL